MTFSFIDLNPTAPAEILADGSLLFWRSKEVVRVLAVATQPNSIIRDLAKLTLQNGVSYPVSDPQIVDDPLIPQFRWLFENDLEDEISGLLLKPQSSFGDRYFFALGKQGLGVVLPPDERLTSDSVPLEPGKDFSIAFWFNHSLSLTLEKQGLESEPYRYGFFYLTLKDQGATCNLSFGGSYSNSSSYSYSSYRYSNLPLANPEQYHHLVCSRYHSDSDPTVITRIYLDGELRAEHITEQGTVNSARQYPSQDYFTLYNRFTTPAEVDTLQVFDRAVSATEAQAIAAKS